MLLVRWLRRVFLIVVISLVCLMLYTQQNTTTKRYPHRDVKQRQTFEAEVKGHLHHHPGKVQNTRDNIAKEQIKPRTNAQQTLNQLQRQRTKSTLVKPDNINIYLFSAVGVSYTKFTYIKSSLSTNGTSIDETQPMVKYTVKRGRTNQSSIFYNNIVLNGWEDRLINVTSFTCCIQLLNGTIVSSVSRDKRKWTYTNDAELQANQYVCPISVHHSMIQFVSVTHANNTCTFDMTSYIKPVFPPNQRSKGIAVCLKLAFGSLDPERIIEWMEVHRYFGVKKVLVYPIDLNAKAIQVLKYYRRLGFAQMIDFDLPQKVTVSREVGSKNIQSWNDEQVALFDCQERLGTYKYVAVIDTDEYLVTANNISQNAWMEYLDKSLKPYRFSGLRFQTRLHLTDWGPTSNTSTLYIGQYLNSTEVILDRPKHIYMPARIIPGSVSTHGLVGLPMHYMKLVSPTAATLHHFRRCREEWIYGISYINSFCNRPDLRYYKTNNLCKDFKRYKSVAIENIAKFFAETVQDKKRKFQLA